MLHIFAVICRFLCKCGESVNDGNGLAQMKKQVFQRPQIIKMAVIFYNQNASLLQNSLLTYPIIHRGKLP